MVGWLSRLFAGESLSSAPKRRRRFARIELVIVYLAIVLALGALVIWIGYELMELVVTLTRHRR